MKQLSAAAMGAVVGALLAILVPLGQSATIKTALLASWLPPPPVNYELTFEQQRLLEVEQARCGKGSYAGPNPLDAVIFPLVASRNRMREGLRSQRIEELGQQYGLLSMLRLAFSDAARRSLSAELEREADHSLGRVMKVVGENDRLMAFALCGAFYTHSG